MPLSRHFNPSDLVAMWKHIALNLAVCEPRQIRLLQEQLGN